MKVKIILLVFIATSLFAQEYTGTDLNHATIGLTKDMIGDSLQSFKDNAGIINTTKVNNADTVFSFTFRGNDTLTQLSHHTFDDFSVINTPYSATEGYASFDSKMTFNSSYGINHINSYQARPQIIGSGDISNVTGYTVNPTFSGTGTISYYTGLNIQRNNTAQTITNAIGVNIDGTEWNLALSIAGGKSYFGGNVGIGVVPSNALDVVGTTSLKGFLTFPYNSSSTAYQTSSYPTFFSTAGGGTYPFSSNGNLIIQGRSGSSVGDIILATGNTASPILTVKYDGNVEATNTLFAQDMNAGMFRAETIGASNDDNAGFRAEDTNVTVLNKHAFDDYSVLNVSSSTGSLGYASFDANTVLNGTAATNHFNGYQYRGTANLENSMTLSAMTGYKMAGVFTGTVGSTISNYYGFRSKLTHGSAGYVTRAFGYYCDGYERTSTGYVGNYYGMYMDSSRAALYDDFAVYTKGSNHPSWFGGNLNSGAGYNFATDTDTDDAYKITLQGAHRLITGLEVTFKAVHANTDGATLQVNSLTAKALTKASSGAINTALATGDILAGQIVKAVYDGTQFQIISRLAQ